jgi:alkanesulfonate monooxygenase SsuD/methylene tetrahydromethanopterin reductase-like flavin-dependent oxidoreductase (luciferase family)
LERLHKRLNRREGKPKDVLKSDFRPWWTKRIAYEEMMERRARAAGMDWKIEVAVILERNPVILPDKDDWEKEYEELHAYLAQFGKEYPKEFTGEAASGLDDEMEPVFTDEELIGKFCVSSA